MATLTMKTAAAPVAHAPAKPFTVPFPAMLLRVLVGLWKIASEAQDQRARMYLSYYHKHYDIER